MGRAGRNQAKIGRVACQSGRTRQLSGPGAGRCVAPAIPGVSAFALLCSALWLCLFFVLGAANVKMHSLSQEIKSFSRNNLRKQCTRVTTVTGRTMLETWKDATIQVVEEVEPVGGGGCGFVQDLSLDLQVGVVKPWLLLGEY